MRPVRTALVCVFLAACVLAGSGGCGGDCGGRVCVDGLEIRVRDMQGDPVLQYEGEADFDQRTVVFGCDGVTPTVGEQGRPFLCLEGGRVVVFGSAETTEARVTVRSEEHGTFEQTLEPDFQPVFPNGPDCPAECMQAPVEATLSP